jgi:hypothetical protein
MEEIRKLKEYVDVLMNMDVQSFTKQIPHEIRRKILSNTDS